MLLATGTLGTVMIAVVFIGLPIAALMFSMGAETRYSEIGKGDLSMDHDYGEDSMMMDTAEVREEEVRQMIQARSDRGVARGREPLDVGAEVKKALDSAGPNV